MITKKVINIILEIVFLIVADTVCASWTFREHNDQFIPYISLLAWS